jgi:hypothetical protein
MKPLLCLLTALLFHTTAVGQNLTATLISEGAYEEDQVVQPANAIKAKVGSIFGFRYKITGLPDQTYYDFTASVTHPPMLINRKLSSDYKTTIQEQVEDGQIESAVVYTIQRDFELVSGVWTIKLLYQDQVLLSRQFIIK